MTLEEFIAYIREHVGYYCTDEHWQTAYSSLKDKTLEGVNRELPFLAIHAITTDYTGKYG